MMSLLRLLLFVQGVICVQVSTKNGKLRGSHIKNQIPDDYYAFRGIPYAKPPVGNLTSKDPQPIGRWKGVLDATVGREPCSRSNTTDHTLEAEDCLYLNIYTRKIRRWLPPAMVHTYQASPIVVYFHGETSTSGKTRAVSETENILDKKVVKVFVNHRQRGTGSTQDSFDIVTKDQLLALRWIKDNIASFGGDPERATVFEGPSGLAELNMNQLEKGT